MTKSNLIFNQLFPYFSYEVSTQNIKQGISYITQLILNKEKELISELKIIKSEKLQSIEKAQSDLNSLKTHLNEVLSIIKGGFENPHFTLKSGEKYIDNRVENCEAQVGKELMDREQLDINMPTLMNLTPLNKLLSDITYNAVKTPPAKILDDAELDYLVNQNLDGQTQDESADDIPIDNHPHSQIARNESFLSLKSDRKEIPELHKADTPITTSKDNIDTSKFRSRKNHKGYTSRTNKRPISSYGTHTKSNEKFGSKHVS